MIAEKAYKDTKKSVDSTKKETVLKQQELELVHKGQLALRVRDHGEAITLTEIGEYNLTSQGLKEFQDVLRAKMH